MRREKLEVLVAAGIGLRLPAQVVQCAALGFDMVVVGTALLERMLESEAAFLSYLDSLHAASFGEREQRRSCYRAS